MEQLNPLNKVKLGKELEAVTKVSTTKKEEYQMNGIENKTYLLMYYLKVYILITIESLSVKMRLAKTVQLPIMLICAFTAFEIDDFTESSMFYIKPHKCVINQIRGFVESHYYSQRFNCSAKKAIEL